MLSLTPLGHIRGCFLKKLIKSKVEYPNENINTYCLLLSKPGISISKSHFFLEKCQQRQRGIFLPWERMLMQCGWPQHSGGASRTNLTHKYILLGLFFNWLSKFTIQAISHKRLLKTWKNHQTWATWPQSAGAELKLPPYWAVCSSPFSVYSHLGDASSPVGVGTVIPDVSQYPSIIGQRGEQWLSGFQEGGSSRPTCGS